MKTDFLDDLKGSWKKQEVQKNFDSEQIVQMLQRKSTNCVKWILIISIVEFLFGITAAIISLLSLKIRQGHKILFGEFYVYFEAFNIINLFVVFAFIGLFYHKYKKVSNHSSIKDLMHSILAFRKYAHYYIYYNFFILFLIAVFLFLVEDEFIIDLFLNQILEPEKKAQIQENRSKISWFFKIFYTVFTFLFLFAYYYLIYGIFLRRLKRNWKKLTEITP